MKTPISILLSICAVPLAWATAQEPDYLELDNQTFALNSNPLESYLDANSELRKLMPNPSRTSCWRGYIATFAVTNKELFVKNVSYTKYEKRKDDTWHEEEVSIIDTLFPKGSSRKVDWFTGILILPHGKVVQYVHMGYASTYESYKLIYFEKGELKTEAIFTHDEYREYKHLQFEAFKKTERYKKMIEEDLAREPKREQSFYDNFIFIFDRRFPEETLLNYKDFTPLPKVKEQQETKTLQKK